MPRADLTDLDSMIINVRDPGSRDLISEALQAYRAGALRSAIVFCWTAVLSDLIKKIRELSHGGNKAARAYVESIDRSVDNAQKMLKIEREILRVSRERFLMYDHHDERLFERIKKDRNSCAHPILAGDEGHFTPTPELARAHLAHALDRLLVRPPAQGKEALLRLWRDLAEPRLPLDWHTAVALVHDRYIEPGTETLRRLIARAAIRGLLHHDDPFRLMGHPAYTDVPTADRRRGFLACLEALGNVDRSLQDEVLSEYVRNIDASGEPLPQLTALLAVSWRNAIWSMLADPARGQIKRLLDQGANNPQSSLVPKHLVPAFGCIAVNDLSSGIRSIAEKARGLDFDSIMIFDRPPTNLIDLALTRFENAGSFFDAEHRFANYVRPMFRYLDISHIHRILDAVLSNGQILAAFRTPSNITSLLNFLHESDENLIRADKWRAFWRELTETPGYVADGYQDLRDALAQSQIISVAPIEKPQP